jgi:L-amino acid N-acyltransferase YncA
MALIVRDATMDDAPDILAIYNFVAMNTTAVWADDPSDLEARCAWVRSRQEMGYPVLVAICDDRLAGFASFGDFRPWSGYRRTVENSVYVDQSFHRRGVGRHLMEALIARAVALRKHAMVAGIEAANTTSIALHASLGFSEVGRMPEVGCKFDRWLDLVLMQKQLTGDETP